MRGGSDTDRGYAARALGNLAFDAEAGDDDMTKCAETSQLSPI